MVPTPPHLVGSTGLHQQYPPKMAPALGGSSPHITMLTTAIAGHHSQSCWGQVLHISVAWAPTAWSPSGEQGLRLITTHTSL